jgi:2-polyprenyl-3-methyl-5-hydroxy-6-metoxy-1,4-benzoquinol methylase
LNIPPLRYVSRYKFLCEQATGKKVLHLGCVGDRIMPAGELTLHEALSRPASEIWGVDLNEKGLEALGRNLPALKNRLLVGDACRLSELATKLPANFDVILAGDIIEHLTNPAELFQSCQSRLAPAGVLILTTPNALGLLNVLRSWRRKECVNPTHTCWFSFSTLEELTRRVDWRVQQYWTCYDHEGYATWKKSLAAQFFKIFPQWGGTLIASAAPAHGADKQRLEERFVARVGIRHSADYVETVPVSTNR